MPASLHWHVPCCVHVSAYLFFFALKYLSTPCGPQSYPLFCLEISLLCFCLPVKIHPSKISSLSSIVLGQIVALVLSSVLPSRVRTLRCPLLFISSVHLVTVLQILPRISYSSFQTYQLAGFLSDLHMAFTSAWSDVQGPEHPKLVPWECSHGHKAYIKKDADA